MKCNRTAISSAPKQNCQDGLHRAANSTSISPRCTPLLEADLQPLVPEVLLDLADAEGPEVED